LECIAQIDGTPVVSHFTHADKEVGVRVVSAVRQLDDRVPDHLKRFVQRRAGKRQHIVAFLELPIIAVPAQRWD
jgi:hypothetical protein